jgi:16S rRNA (guanine966-N2)-methyltransferase
MRIIAGTAHGRRLVVPGTTDTRPATDRVREAVFSTIGAWVEEARVLDLYAGSGSFGLEALSRGAKSATFVENGQKALDALRRNVEAVGLGGTVVGSTAHKFLRRCEEAFDLIFIDPPWSVPTSEMERDLALIDGLLAVHGELVLSRRHTDSAPDGPKNWRVATDRRYGDTRIVRYEKEAEDV